MRDKVKRFISILMTALMLVNLLPVGALADGITSIGYKPEVAASTGNHTVYVYARFDGDPLPGVTLNASQWYTIGYIANVDLPSPGGISWGKYWYYNNNNYCGSTINSTSASGIIGGLVQEYNKSIVIKSDEWIGANFKACPGADTYMEGTSEPAWHLDIIVDINKNPPVHNLVFKVNNSNGKQIGTPKKVTGRWTNPLSSNKYYAGNPVPETIIDGGRIYQLKTKREGNPNLGTKIYFDEPIKNVEFYYKDMGPVKRNYTVNHYWMGEQNKPIKTETKEAELGSTVTKSPIKIDGYTPVSDASQSITIIEGKNEINFYYYKNVKLEANSKTVPYNGQEQSVSGFIGAPTEADFSAITVGAKGTDVGEYPAEFADGTVGKVDTSKKYIVTAANPGTLTITPQAITVKVTGNHATAVYDGNEHVAEGYTATLADGNKLPSGVKITLKDNEKAEAKRTEVGTTNMDLTADSFNIESTNYNVTIGEVTDGYVTITPVTDAVTVTITENAGTEKYDGTEKTVTGYTVTNISNKLYAEKDFTFNGTAEVKGTDAGTYDMALKASDFTNRNANFSKVTFVIEDGQLVIEKRKVTLTSASDEKVYDGNALTNGEVTVSGDGFVKGEGATYDVTGTQTNVGKSKNTFSYKLKDNTKAENYTITTSEGTLEVTAVTDEVVVTIKENAGTAKYDGTEKTVTGYTVTNISNKLYAEKDFTFNGTAEVKGTDAGTYDMALKASDFTNRNANFSKVTFKIEDGQLVIEKRKVTLTSASDSKTYDGTALTNGTVTVGGAVGFADGEGATYKVTGTQTNVGSSDNTFTYTLKKGTKADNYDIKTENGTLTVTPVTDKVTVTITGNTASEKYDGTEKTASGYGVSISNEKYTEADFEFKGNAEVKGTDANTYPMGLTAANFTNKSANFANVEFVVTDGSLTINKRSVTLTSASDSKVYDGTALTNDKVTVGGADGFADGEGAEYNVTGTQTNVGSSDNTFTYTLKKGTKADNYDIKTENGTLTVTPVTDKVTVTITGNTASEKYDGTEKTASGYGVSISNEKYTEADFEFKGNAEVKGTDANTYPMGLTAANFTNKSANFANVEFVVTDGSLTINKRSVTLTSAPDSKVYDGNALTNDTVTVSGDGFAKDEGAAYDVTGTQTDVGTSDNTFTYTLNKGTKADNYSIELVFGKLEVTPVTDEVIVTITGRTHETTYDGKEHSVFGYDVTVSNALYTPKEDMRFNGIDADATAKGTDAGTYPMELTAENFTNISDNFTNVTFVVTDGYVKINPRAVTLTSETAGKTYDGTALEKPVVTVGGDGFVEGQVKEIKATGSVTNAGSVANTITFTPNKETFKDGNYAITKTEGTLTIAKRSVLITSPSATKTYDGSALTRPAVTITGDGFVPGELAKAEATGSITKVGSTPNTIQYTTTGAFNAANYSIALSVGTLTVTEKPKPEPRRTFNLTINYVYQNGKRAAASYNRGGLKNGETFDITSPVIAGYTASETVVSGTIYNRDIKVTVIYTADGVNLDDYGVPLGLGNITMNVGDCFE